MNVTIKDRAKPVTSTDLVVIFGIEGTSTALPKGVRMPVLAKKAFREGRKPDWR